MSVIAPDTRLFCFAERRARSVKSGTTFIVKSTFTTTQMTTGTANCHERVNRSRTEPTI